jgi:hypothetical protein
MYVPPTHHWTEDEWRRFWHNLNVTVNYWMEQLTTDDRPPEVVMAMAELCWTWEKFRPVAGAVEAGDGLITLHDIENETGESAYDLLVEEWKGQLDDDDEDEAEEEASVTGDC